MNNEQFEKAMREAGFNIWNTGGGCTAWGFARPDGLDVMACQDLHHEWTPEIVDPNSDWLDYGAGLVDSDGQAMDETHRSFKNIEELIAYVIQLKEVNQ